MTEYDIKVCPMHGEYVDSVCPRCDITIPARPSTAQLDPKRQTKPVLRDSRAKQSHLEVSFLRAFRAFGIGYKEPVSEYRFHPERRWRFDFAWVEEMVAVEMEGIGGKSRHRTYPGYKGDLEKYNQATLLGWSVLRFHEVTPDAIRMVIEMIDKRRETE